MKTPHYGVDIFSMTNPALGAMVIYKFIVGYRESDGRGCDFVLLFLPLPLILPANTRREFRGSNSSTGLLAWIERKPMVLIELARKVEETEAVSRQAILFALTNKIIAATEDGSFVEENSNLFRSKLNFPDEERKSIAQAARTLGNWCGQVGSVEKVLAYLGVRI